MRRKDPDTPSDFGDEDPTVLDGTPFEDTDTPTSLPRCQTCGSLVFLDDYTPAAAALASGIFTGSGQCMRSRSGSWAYCANFDKDGGELRIKFPR